MRQSQLLKGLLGLAVLAVLNHEESYGYDVARQLRGSGLDDVAESSVYGALRRLHAEGAVSCSDPSSTSGPMRRVYLITTGGQERLAAEASAWRRFADSVDGLLATAGGRADQASTLASR